MTTVLLHPIGLDRATWAAVPTAAARAVDLPGHGEEPWCDPHDLGEVADAILAGLPPSEPLDLVGVSLGGMVALHAALRHRDRVRSLVVACAPAAAPTEVMLRRAAETESVGMAGTLESTLARWFSSAALTERLTYVEKTRRRLLGDDAVVVASYWRLIAEHDVSDRLSEILVPTTVIAGTADVSVPPAAARALAEGVPDAQYVELAGAHMIHLEAPQAFSDALDRHLARVNART